MTQPIPGAPKTSLAALVVEDEPSVREVVAKTLELAGHTVYQAARPAEALEVCQRLKTQIQVLVTDITMPGINGWQLAEYLKAIIPGLKIIFMSGFGDTRLTGSPYAIDARFVEKPFRPSILLQTIEELVRS